MIILKTIAMARIIKLISLLINVQGQETVLSKSYFGKYSSS